MWIFRLEMFCYLNLKQVLVSPEKGTLKWFLNFNNKEVLNLLHLPVSRIRISNNSEILVVKN